MEVWAVEKEFKGCLVQRRQVLRLGREADFGGQASGVFVFGELGEIELGAFGGGYTRSGCVLGRGAAGDGGWVVGDCGFGELFLSDFVGDVGAGEGADVDAEFFADGFGEEGDVFGADVDAFNARNPACVG